MYMNSGNTRYLPDILFLFVFLPLFLTVVYFTSLNSAFILHTDDYTIFTIYATNFAHFDYNHFMSNLLSYMVIILLIFIFFRIFGLCERKNFYLNLLTIFIIAPFGISLFSLLIYDMDKILGFSGIVSSLLGYFTASFVTYTYKKADINLNRTILFLFPVIFFNLSILSLIRYGLIENTGLDLLLIFILSIYLLDEAKIDIIKIYHSFKNNNLVNSNFKNIPFYWYAIATVLFFFTFTIGLWLILFPEKVLNNGNITNIQGHYIGFMIGTLTPILTYNLKVYIKKLTQLN
ncbi:hypothetical protein Metev_1899 [Methanohalobium evestigatum Z-7303]|uniref:Peptidase S54 rhomboid domain-containing protein n=2 Tax=Methanohalobium evestigatum TaxID=2322 RepID=D7EA59_METEZ|nr:hypothetical protein Metev_1899 [Methanohalobium evestigatum Z-7303]